MEHKTKQQKTVVSCPTRISQLQSNLNSNKCVQRPKQAPTKLCEYCKLRNIYSVLNWPHTFAKFIKKRNKKRIRSRSDPKRELMRNMCVTKRTTKPNQLYYFLYKIIWPFLNHVPNDKLVWINNQYLPRPQTRPKQRSVTNKKQLCRVLILHADGWRMGWKFYDDLYNYGSALFHTNWAFFGYPFHWSLFQQTYTQHYHHIVETILNDGFWRF